MRNECILASGHYQQCLLKYLEKALQCDYNTLYVCDYYIKTNSEILEH